MIQGSGYGKPDVMFIGDFAQGEDLTSNYALQGFKRNLLEQFAKQAGFNLNETYTTLLIKEGLPAAGTFETEIGKNGKPKKKKKKNKRSDIELGKFLNEHLTPSFGGFLLDEIRTLEPNLLVPLGETSFQFLTGLEGIRKFRGSILPLSPVHGIQKYTKVLPILGPYPYLYQDPKAKFISQVDFCKIPKWTDGRSIPDDTFRIWIAKSVTELRNFFERVYPLCKAKSIAEGGFVVFDIETFMNIPTCISFCFDGFESVCVPFIDASIDFTQRALMIDLCAKLLASDLPKVNQNIKYDWKTQERWKFRVNSVVGDTMLASSTLYCEFPKNLGFLTSIYTDIPYFKDEGRQYDPTKHRKEQFYLYNAKDSLATHQIYFKQLPELDELGVRPVYEKLIQLLPIYRRMEDRGIAIDEDERSKKIAKYQSLFRIHLKILRSLTGDEFLNPLSWVQSDRIIFDEMGFKKIPGVKGTDEESLNMLMCFGNPDKCTLERGKEILRSFINCRKLHKVLEVLELDIYPDGRFRCEANLAGTETGRTSMSQTTDYFVKEKLEGGKQKVQKINLGHSLQTIGKHGFYIDEVQYGKDVRSIFVPSFNYEFGEIDLSGAEARVDRVLSGNFDLSVFDNPGIHKLTGSWIFDTTPDKIKKNTLEYLLSKIFRHAGERNMGPRRAFSMCQDEGVGLSLSLQDVTKKLENFHANEPNIQKVFHRDIEKAIKTSNNLICPNGRRRDFFDRIDHHTINEGISFLPQAIVSDQTKFSFIPTSAACPWAHLLVEAHDGSLWEYPKARREEFHLAYKKNIETPIDFRFGSLKRDYQLVIPAENSVGMNWMDLKEIQL